MAQNLFENAKFGDMFLTAENKQAVFLRFTENAEYKFAILYIEGWGNVQVFRHNGKEVHGDVAYSVVGKKEEPLSEIDLEKALEDFNEHYVDDNGFFNPLDLAKYFYDKGYFNGHIHDGDRIEHIDGRKVNVSRLQRVAKPIGEPVSEDLDKEMDNYLLTVFSKDMDGGKPRFTTWFKALQKTAIHFAKWQKEQMMAKAIDVKINRDTLYDLKPFIHEKYLDYKIGDKCKMILIKEEKL